MALASPKNDWYIIALKQGAISADTWSNYIDLDGVESVLIGVSAELDTADADNYITPVLKEATATPASTASYSSVAAANIDGTAFTAAVATGAAAIQWVGYKGASRYLAVLLDETSTAVGEFHVFAAVKPNRRPASTAPTTGAIS